MCVCLLVGDRVSYTFLIEKMTEIRGGGRNTEYASKEQEFKLKQIVKQRSCTSVKITKVNLYKRNKWLILSFIRVKGIQDQHGVKSQLDVLCCVVLCCVVLCG